MCLARFRVRWGRVPRVMSVLHKEKFVMGIGACGAYYTELIDWFNVCHIIFQVTFIHFNRFVFLFIGCYACLLYSFVRWERTWTFLCLVFHDQICALLRILLNLVDFTDQFRVGHVLYEFGNDCCTYQHHYLRDSSNVSNQVQHSIHWSLVQMLGRICT